MIFILRISTRIVSQNRDVYWPGCDLLGMSAYQTIPHFEKALERLAKKYPSLKLEYMGLIKIVDIVFTGSGHIEPVFHHSGPGSSPQVDHGNPPPVHILMNRHPLP